MDAKNLIITSSVKLDDNPFSGNEMENTLVEFLGSIDEEFNKNKSKLEGHEFMPTAKSFYKVRNLS